MATLDPSFQPRVTIIERNGGGFLPPFAGALSSVTWTYRLRTEWAGDSDWDNSNSLLNSFRNRVPRQDWASQIVENWQCWQSGTSPNGSTLWTADITLEATTGINPPNLPSDTDQYHLAQRERILRSLHEHFQRSDITIEW